MLSRGDRGLPRSPFFSPDRPRPARCTRTPAASAGGEGQQQQLPITGELALGGDRQRGRIEAA